MRNLVSLSVIAVFRASTTFYLSAGLSMICLFVAPTLVVGNMMSIPLEGGDGNAYLLRQFRQKPVDPLHVGCPRLYVDFGRPHIVEDPLAQALKRIHGGQGIPEHSLRAHVRRFRAIGKVVGNADRHLPIVFVRRELRAIL